jgi:DNA-binding XRE family transcriptional regulator
MPRSSNSLSALPQQTAEPLRNLGLRLRAHRVHRGWTIAEMAERLLCSPTTLRSLESGKPATSIGLLAHAAWPPGAVSAGPRHAGPPA